MTMVFRTPHATLARLAAMARTAHKPAAPQPRQRMRTRDDAARDAKARDAFERKAQAYQLRQLNDANRRFWRDSAPEKGLIAGVHSEPPPGPGPAPRYGVGSGGQYNVGVSAQTAFECARSGSDTMALSHGGDPIADLGRKPAMGSPSEELPLATMNAVNHHHWGMRQEKRSDFLSAIRQLQMNGGDVSPAGVARIAAMFA